jgi:hypothetical protein
VTEREQVPRKVATDEPGAAGDEGMKWGRHSISRRELVECVWRRYGQTTHHGR